MELIYFRDFLLNYNGCERYDMLIHFIKGYNSISVEKWSIYFRDIIQKFYNENPQFVVTIKIEKTINNINTKMTTMEQFQAQIIDKLTVFAEMIDELQNKQKSLSEFQAQILDKLTVFAETIDSLQNK